MTQYMTDTFGPNPVLRDWTFIPFTIYAELVVDGYGKRQEVFHDFRKRSDKIEKILNNYEINQSYLVELSSPVKWELKFGNLYPRVTITGHARRTNAPNQHKENITIIQSNEFKVGYGSNNSANTEPVDKIDQYAKEIYDAITEITAELMTIHKMNIANIIYGQTGRTIQ